MGKTSYMDSYRFGASKCYDYLRHFTCKTFYFATVSDNQLISIIAQEARPDSII